MARKRKRIFHGPVNVVGMPRILADYQREAGYRSDCIVFFRNRFMPNSHRDLRLDRFRNKYILWLVRLWHMVLLVPRYDLFHFYFGWSLLPRNWDLPLLKLLGKKIIMTYCGSDIRLVEEERQRNRYHELLRVGLDHPQHDGMKKKMMAWQNRWIDRFIAPRGLYAHATAVIPREKVIEDLWIHDTMDFSGGREPDYKPHKPPVVVHAPSEKGIKGSVYIEAAVEKLQKDGVAFEYLCLQDMPNTEVQEILRTKADIILDQVIIGGFGHLAIEAMYYGKTVLSYIIPEVAAFCCPDCPVVNTTIDTLEDDLRSLIADEAERIRRGRAGYAFVRKYCERDMVNRKLLRLYETLLPGPVDNE